MNKAGLSLETAEILATMDDGATISIRQWGQAAAERVILAHGNGLAADGFAEFGAALVARGFEVVAYDMRNHGRSTRHEVTGGNWERFIADLPAILLAIDQTFGQKPAHGAFHSLSAAICLLSQTQFDYPWKTLTLFEPPIPPRAGSPLHGTFSEYHRELSARAIRRRRKFDEPAELYASMRRSPLFQRVGDAALVQLAQATLRPSDPDGWELSCKADFEAKTFLLEGVAPLREKLTRAGCPVRIVLGDRAIHYAAVLVDAGRELAGEFGYETIELQDATHFMQIETPVRCAGLVAGGGPQPRT